MDGALADSDPRALFAAPPSWEPPAPPASVTEEMMLPEQFFTAAERSSISWTLERRLLLAVLEDTVVMFLRYRHDRTTRGKRLFPETHEWFASTDRTQVCAFETICDYLNLDANYVRQGLRRFSAPDLTTPLPLHTLRRQPRTRTTT